MAGIVTFVLALMVMACSPAPSSNAHSAGAGDAQLFGKLVLTGSSTVAPLAAEIAKQFEAAHPGVRVDVQSGGSSRGIRDARQGLADIGMVSRALKPDEADLKPYTIARDGIALVVNANNPVTQLSAEQVVGIYTGVISNWRGVGGAGAPITVINKAEGRSTLELFLQHFQLQNSAIKAHVVIGDNEQGIKLVAGNPNAIAYVSVGTAQYNAQRGLPIKLLPLDGVAASTSAVADGDYPLSRVLTLVTKSEPHGLQKAFIEFAQSSAMKSVVEGQSFVATAP